MKKEDGYCRRELIRQADERIRGTRPRPYWVTLLLLVVVQVGVSFLSRLETWTKAEVEAARFADYFAGEQTIGGLLGALDRPAVPPVLIIAVFWLARDLWSGVMHARYRGYCLSMAREERPGVRKLFRGGPGVGSVLSARIWVSGLFGLWKLIYKVGTVLLVQLLGAVLYPEDLGALVIGIVIGCACLAVYWIGAAWLYLRYAMVDYIVMDRRLSGLAALRESKRLMAGNKGRLLRLNLSFFGWNLLVWSISLAVFIGQRVILNASMSPGSGLTYTTVNLIWWLILLGQIVGTWLLSAWLLPRVRGSEAGFYEFLRGEDHEEEAEDGDKRGVTRGGFSTVHGSVPGAHGGRYRRVGPQ